MCVCVCRKITGTNGGGPGLFSGGGSTADWSNLLTDELLEILVQGEKPQVHFVEVYRVAYSRIWSMEG